MTYYDKNGIPIEPGDLLRHFHFKDGRRNTYLYHTAVANGEYIQCVPTCHLEPSRALGGGVCNLNQQLADCMEIIHGISKDGLTAFYERPKRQLEMA